MLESAVFGSPPPLSDLSADRPVALFLDFDGTLIDIAPSPEAIVVPGGMAAGLERLARRLEGRLALVSGRSVENISAHLGISNIAIAGSHGAELFGADGQRIGPPAAAFPEDVKTALFTYAAQADGLEYEAKSHGAALHYRAAPAREDETRAFAEEIADIHGMAVKYGKCVVEIVHKGADKGNAVRAFMQERTFSDAVPVFLGDDITDEDGFRAAGLHGGFGVIVGERNDTLARYRLISPAGVHEWLGL